MPASAASRAESAEHSSLVSPARAAPSAAAIVPLTPRIRAVEPELADARVLFEAGRWDQPGGCEHGERDRDVEARSLLAQCCRREVHGDHLVGPREP